MGPVGGLVKVLGVAVAAVALVGCVASSPADLGLNPREYSINGANPVSVVEGYFHTWENQDWQTHEQLVDTETVDVTRQPPTSIERLSVLQLEGSESAAVCEASFDLTQLIAVPGSDEPKAERTKHKWTFMLTYSADRSSSVITGIERD